MSGVKQWGPDDFGQVPYRPGECQTIMTGPYRFEIMIGMDPVGRRKAKFGNEVGEQPYFEFVRVAGGSGLGGSIVPFFIDASGTTRFLMVLEQRGPLILYDSAHAHVNGYVRQRVFERESGGSIDLGDLGSMEFPGGGLTPGESIKAGKIRETLEELGIENARVDLTWTRAPIYPMGSDVAAANFRGVMLLPQGNYERYVDNDGGLQVYAFCEREVDHNIAIGAVSSGQAALAGWDFYKMMKDPERRDAVKAARRRGIIIEEHGIEVVR